MKDQLANDSFGVIFDLDGVLVDTTGLNFQIFQELLDPYGIKLTPDDIRRHLGTSIHSKAKAWSEEYGIDLDPSKFLEDFERIKTRINYNSKIKLQPNVIDFLVDLKENNIPCGVGTSSTRERAEGLLENKGIRNYFNVLITSEDVTESKPSPEIFLKVAKRLTLMPQKCFVIEDAGNGIEAAKKGGMIAVGYHNSFNTFEKFENADLIIENFSELSFERLKKHFTNNE